MVLWNSTPLSVSKEDVTHDGFAAMQLMEKHITVDAASGMLQQEAWRAKRQPAFLSLLQCPLDFVPAYFLPPKTWIRSCKALCRRSSKKSPVRDAVGRKGSAQPCFSRAVQGFEQSSLPSADVVRRAQAKPCSNSVIIKIPGRSCV